MLYFCAQTALAQAVRYGLVLLMLLLLGIDRTVLMAMLVLLLLLQLMMLMLHINRIEQVFGRTYAGLKHLRVVWARVVLL